jgi:hypothetical protein
MKASSPKLLSLRMDFFIAFGIWFKLQMEKKLCTKGGNNHGFGSLLKERFCTYIAFELIFTNYGILHPCALGTIGKPSMSRGAPSWFCNV